VTKYNNLKNSLPTDNMALDTFANKIRYFINKYPLT